MKSYLLTIAFILFFVSSYSQEKPVSRNSFHLGGGYSEYSADHGFVFFNEYQFNIIKQISVGPSLYFSRNVYNLDNKGAVTDLFGIDLNIYLNVINAKKNQLSFGTGYTIRHRDFSMLSPIMYTYDGYGMANVHRDNKNGAVINIRYDYNLTEKLSIGTKSSWQPFGDNASFYYIAINGGVRF